MNTDSAPQETAAAALYGTTEKVTRIRATIAKRMMESLQGSAQLTATVEVDFTAISAYRAEHKEAFREREGVGLSYLPFIIKASVEALQAYPKVNAVLDLDEGVIRYADGEHIGVAVDTPRGLLVPTVRNASQMSLREFSATSKDLAFQAIDGKISPDLLTGATFTVSNLGGFGIESFTPLLNVPQVAILGVDAIFPRATIDDDGNVGVEQRIGFSLTADHRVIDGADAARFLQDLVAYVENIDITALG